MVDFRPDDLIRELEDVALRTTQGTFVRIGDVRRLIEKHTEQDPEEPAVPNKLRVHQARALATEHLKSQGFGAPTPQESGRAVPATEPQPPSRA